MPRQKNPDATAIPRRRREPRGKLYYYLEPDEGSALGEVYEDVERVATEALRRNKKVIILEYAEVKIENMRLCLTPVK